MDSEDVRRQWAERSGEYSPSYYAYYGPDETSEALRDVLERHVGREAAVLELGCSSGRHLAHLHEAGFTDLTGVEVNPEAFEVMRETYPDLAADGTFHAAAIEDVVGEFPDGRFDAVFSVETLQHVHPEADWVFAEVARVTNSLLITVENEGGGRDGEGDSERDGEGDSERDPEDADRDDDVNDADGGVNYVDDGVPLYYRDWHRVFTALGLVEVGVEAGERDTLRAFRPATTADDGGGE